MKLLTKKFYTKLPSNYSYWNQAGNWGQAGWALLVGIDSQSKHMILLTFPAHESTHIKITIFTGQVYITGESIITHQIWCQVIFVAFMYTHDKWCWGTQKIK